MSNNAQQLEMVRQSTLDDKHYNILSTGSIISDVIIKNRPYFTVEDPDQVLLMGYSEKSPAFKYIYNNGRGIGIPTIGIDGSIVNFTIRFDDPVPSPWDAGKTLRYLAPGGIPTFADFGLGFDPKATEIAFTEGAKKGDAIRSHGSGEAVISLQGVWNYTRKNDKGESVLAPELTLIKWEAKFVYICFDSDIGTNIDIFHAARRLYRMLNNLGAVPRIMYLPTLSGEGKTGIDDYLAAFNDVEYAPFAWKLLKGTTETTAAIHPLPVKKWNTKDYEVFLENRDITFHQNTMDRSIFVNWKGKRVRFDDFHLARIRTMLLDEEQTSTHIEDVVRTLSVGSKFHPIQEKLESIPRPMSNPFHKLSKYFDIEGDDFGEVFETFCRAAVSKVYNGGLIRNFVPVMVSPEEEKGKSYFIRWLCSVFPDHYSDSPFSTISKDKLIDMSRFFLWELSEIASLTRKADRDALKHVLTLQKINERPAYGKTTLTTEVSVNFIGTANNASFLSSQEKNTRFYAILVNDIDHDYAVNIDPAELWGWSYHTWKDGMTIELTPEQRERRNSANKGMEALDPVLERLREHFEFWDETDAEEGQKVCKDAPASYSASFNFMVECCGFTNTQVNQLGHNLNKMVLEGRLCKKRTRHGFLWAGIRHKNDADLEKVKSWLQRAQYKKETGR